MITVYFDGKCGLCSKEIRYYQRIAAKSDFEWLDIASDPAPLAPLGIPQETALRRLHARDQTGHMHRGVDAFIVIWRKLPLWNYVALLVALPLIRQIAGFAYNHFADYRFRKLPHCQLTLAPNTKKQDVKNQP